MLISEYVAKIYPDQFSASNCLFNHCIGMSPGCRDDEGQCVKSGGVMGQKDDCVKFKCKNGELYPIEVGK